MIVTKYCPFCRKELYSFHGTEMIIGPEAIICPGCNLSFKSGRLEFRSMTSSQRFLYFLRLLWFLLSCVVVSAVWVIIIIGIGLMIYEKVSGATPSDNGIIISFLIIYLPFLLFKLFMFLKITFREINESIARTKEGRQVGKIDEIYR